MKLDANATFFNWSNNPWHVFRQPLYENMAGKWYPPGNAFSASVVNVVTHGAIDRPDWMGAQFCAAVSGDKAEFVLYASDAAEFGPALYPWQMQSWTPLVQWIADPLVSGVSHYWKDVPKEGIDAFIAMKQLYGIRFGVACRFLSETTQVAWHSARMLARY